MKTPQTPSEWQDCVNAAHGAIALDAARVYGLVEGGPEVNVERCGQLLEEGRRLGFTPDPDAAEKFIFALLRTEWISVEPNRFSPL